MTRLEQFLRENKLKPTRVAREAGISRQHLLRVRQEKMGASVAVAMRIRDACRRLLPRRRRVRLAEVFEVA